MSRQEVKRICLEVFVPNTSTVTSIPVNVICKQSTRGDKLQALNLIDRDGNRNIFRGWTQGRIIEGIFEIERSGLKWVVGYAIDLTDESNAYLLGLGIIRGDEEIPARWKNFIPNQIAFNDLDVNRWFEHTEEGVTLKAGLFGECISTPNWSVALHLRFNV